MLINCKDIQIVSWSKQEIIDLLIGETQRKLGRNCYGSDQYSVDFLIPGININAAFKGAVVKAEVTKDLPQEQK